MASTHARTDVLGFMTRQNRPYSLNDIVAALQNTHGKAAISKAVDDLVNEDALYEKLNGKQKVFVIPQSTLPRPDDNELMAMDGQIESLTNTLKEIQESIKSAEAELKLVESSLSIDEARQENAKIEAEIESVKKSIASLDSQEVQISPEDFTKAEKRCQSAVSEWKKRKRMAMEIIDAVAEGYPKSRRQMMEDMGVETDEDRGVSLSAFL
ncbi:hypothetical protein AAHC03_014051 [Spirometra sp. Aus1]